MELAIVKVPRAPSAMFPSEQAHLIGLETAIGALRGQMIQLIACAPSALTKPPLSALLMVMRLFMRAVGAGRIGTSSITFHAGFNFAARLKLVTSSFLAISVLVESIVAIVLERITTSGTSLPPRRARRRYRSAIP